MVYRQQQMQQQMQTAHEPTAADFVEFLKTHAKDKGAAKTNESDIISEYNKLSPAEKNSFLATVETKIQGIQTHDKGITEVSKKTGQHYDSEVAGFDIVAKAAQVEFKYKGQEHQHFTNDDFGFVGPRTADLFGNAAELAKVKAVLTASSNAALPGGATGAQNTSQHVEPPVNRDHTAAPKHDALNTAIGDDARDKIYKFVQDAAATGDKTKFDNPTPEFKDAVVASFIKSAQIEDDLLLCLKDDGTMDQKEKAKHKEAFSKLLEKGIVDKNKGAHDLELNFTDGVGGPAQKVTLASAGISAAYKQYEKDNTDEKMFGLYDSKDMDALAEEMGRKDKKHLDDLRQQKKDHHLTGILGMIQDLIASFSPEMAAKFEKMFSNYGEDQGVPHQGRYDNHTFNPDHSTREQVTGQTLDPLSDNGGLGGAGHHHDGDEDDEHRNKTTDHHKKSHPIGRKGLVGLVAGIVTLPYQAVKGVVVGVGAIGQDIFGKKQAKEFEVSTEENAFISEVNKEADGSSKDRQTLKDLARDKHSAVWKLEENLEREGNQMTYAVEKALVTGVVPDNLNKEERRTYKLARAAGAELREHGVTSITALGAADADELGTLSKDKTASKDDKTKTADKAADKDDKATSTKGKTATLDANDIKGPSTAMSAKNDHMLAADEVVTR